MLVLHFFVWIPSLCCIWSLTLNQPPTNSVWGRWKVILVYLSHLPFHNSWQCKQEWCSASVCSPAMNIYTWGLNLWCPTFGRLSTKKFLILVLNMSRTRTGPLCVLRRFWGVPQIVYMYKKKLTDVSILNIFSTNTHLALKARSF